MLKHAADLSDSHEYFIVWAGDTNARPGGTKAEGYSLFPEFELAADGMTFTADISTSTATFDIAIGAAESITKNEFAGATIRLGARNSGVAGYGTVVTNAAIAAGALSGSITVTWTTAPTVTSSTQACYFVRETLGDRKWGSYPQVRVLTPYQPVVDSATAATIEYPSTSATGGAIAYSAHRLYRVWRDYIRGPGSAPTPVLP